MRAGASASSKARDIAEDPRAASRAEVRAEVRLEARAGAGVGAEAEAEAGEGEGVEVGVYAEAGTCQDLHRHPQICSAKKDKLGNRRSNNRKVYFILAGSASMTDGAIPAARLKMATTVEARIISNLVNSVFQSYH
jgi:hypothetical protein